MASSYSLDLRIRVMDDVNRGLSTQSVSQKYSISQRVIYQWKKHLEETGSLAPRKSKTGPKPKLEPHRHAIVAAVDENPSITLEELQSQLNLPGCLPTLWYALRRWGIVLKKSNSGRGTTTS